MGNPLQKNPVMKFQGILGVIVLAAVGLLAWCHLNGLIFEERPVRAHADARELARAALDFHADRGHWPQNSGGEVDLTLLLGNRPGRSATAMAGASGGLSGAELSTVPAATGPSWLKEVPLDPWGRPYQVMVTDIAIAVVSAGPDGRLDTEPAHLWSRPGNINPGDGDDVGIVLEIDPHGESR
jgi:hypothetical protein